MRNRMLGVALVALGCVALGSGCGDEETTPDDTTSSGSGAGSATSSGTSSGTSTSSTGTSSSSQSSTSSGAGGGGSGTGGSGTGGGGSGDASLIGFAAYDSDGVATTTGGSGGEVVLVTSYQELVAALGDDAPRVIQVSGTIQGNGTPMLRVTSNKTIIGVGSDATIDGFGFDVSGWTSGGICTPETPTGYTPVSNVVIRNLTFINSADDSINIPCFSHHVWVDHNTFEESFDGSVDVKRGSDWVTVSWNHFHQTVKTCLLGHDDGNAAQDTGNLHVTYHHNWFDHTDQRNPRVRFGQAHVFNNFGDNIGDYMIGKGVECSIHADGNYVLNSGDASDDYGGEDFTWTDTNVLDNTEPPTANGQGFDPAQYYSWTPDPAADIPTLVPAGAGAGILTGAEF